MSFDALETSIASGQPVWLYELVRGARTWRYTSADRDQALGSIIYTQLAIAHDRIEATSEQASRQFTVTLPAVADAVQDYRTGQPGEPMLVRIRARHAGDAEAVLQISGKAQQVGFPAGGSCTIQCVTPMGEMQQTGLRSIIARNCPLAVYGQGDGQCNLDPAPWRVDTTVAAASGVVVHAAAWAAYPDGYFSGGRVEWQSGVAVQRRMVLDHTGDALTLMGADPGIDAGIAISAWPGCARTTVACIGFGNLLNYGGVPALPDRSPFDGNPVY